MQSVRAAYIPEFLLSVSLPPLPPSFTSLPSLRSALSHSLPLHMSVPRSSEEKRGGRGGLHSPSVQQGNPFLTLIRSAKSAIAPHTFASFIGIQFGRKSVDLRENAFVKMYGKFDLDGPIKRLH